MRGWPAALPRGAARDARRLWPPSAANADGVCGWSSGLLRSRYIQCPSLGRMLVGTLCVAHVHQTDRQEGVNDPLPQRSSCPESTASDTLE